MANYNGVDGNALNFKSTKPNTISNLMNALGGGLKKNKFKVILDFYDKGNEFTSLYTDDFGRDFNLLCKDVIMPDRTIQTVQYWHFGRKYSVRAETEYSQSTNMVIIDDNKMSMRRFFDNWMYKIDNTIQTERDGALGKSVMIDKYQCDLKVFQLDNFGNIVYGYKMTHAFPSMIGQISYSQSSADELTEFDVTMTFSEIKPCIEN